MIMLLEIDPSVNLPLWVTGIIAIITALGAAFWKKIASIFESIFSTRQSELARLKKRVLNLENENTQLLNENTALAMGMVFIIEEYEKANPQNKDAIDKLREIMERNLRSNVFKNSTRTSQGKTPLHDEQATGGE